MILNEKEVKTCLLFVLTPLLKKYDIEIQEAELHIHNQVEMKAIVTYQEHVIDLSAVFTISYQNGRLGFENVDGKAEYLFLQLNLMNVLKQMLHDEHIRFQENNCYYVYDLPIQELSIEDEHLYICLSDS